MIERTAHFEQFSLDADVTFLNHGSFGACPIAIQERQAELRDRLERQPVDFFVRFLPGALAAAREKIGAFINADPDGIAFVTNATSGVNTVLKSVEFAPGDELLTTDQAYGACKNALDFVASQTGAKVVVAPIPFPIENSDQIVDAVVAAATDRTKLAMLDHIASPTGLIFPIKRLVAALDERGIDTLVDGAHTVGQIPLDIEDVGAAYYTTNAHKWLCTPRGAAILHVRADRRERIRALVTGHGYVAPLADRFRAEHDRAATHDPTAHLVIPDAIELLGNMMPGGWPDLYATIHQRAVDGRRAIAKALGIEIPSPDDLQGALAALLLSPGESTGPSMLDPLNQVLWETHRIEVPIFLWPRPPARTLRVSAYLYNHPADYERLASALKPLLPKG